MEMRCAAAGSLKHLIPVERKEFLVLLRAPRKGVDAVKAQNVIDAKKMEAASNTANTLSPPIEIPATHYFPVKKRNAPILSPLLGELVVFKMRFRRRASAPIERKFTGPRENVRAVMIDAKWDVAHQRDTSPFGVRFGRGPLFVCDPLDVLKEMFAIVELFSLFGRLSLKPRARGIDVLMLGRPFVPSFALAVFFHQRAKKRIVIEPRRFLTAEFPKLRLSIFRCVRGEVCERFLEQTAFHFFDRGIFHRAVAKLGKIDIGEGGLVIVTR